MNDQPTTHTPEFEVRMRAYIALGLLAAIVVMISYTLYMYGHILAVLTLILGWLTGTANVLLSPYFGSPTAAKKPETNVTVTGDSPTIPVGTDVNNKAPNE
jgi:hypothetical protein